MAIEKKDDGHVCHFVAVGKRVTAKTATPTKTDSKLTEAQLESLKRATKALEGWSREGEATKARRLEPKCGGLHKRFYLTSTGRNSTLFILLSSKRR